MYRIPPAKLMMIYAICNVLFLVLGIEYPGRIGLGAILLTSFFMSIMFPTIFAIGLKHLGSNTNVRGSCLVMAIIGSEQEQPL
jgi:MFS transporter, FHS family, L-fucose permease